ncbi:hypothetical protein ONS95_014614 [Cadophora gregata]|uniref:uncharacterized protein n=1 Tax=Cadophora gregata TaxID=51156 RepID=UPI0026DB143D|nr:uncharacterized protein ONS95_014614 [Cadophora gregata]KAK0112895.1 hypothetical protein ONS95_014614 [Cadophora gregata]KAK0125022.1 hypothetical protein ONS96_008888 [Cadophora gregata f. sp. sojae]
MFSDFSAEQALKSIQQIQWKHILIFTICLMGLHFILFEETPSDLSASTPPQAASPASPSPPAQQKAKPKPKPLPVVDVSDAEKPHVDNTPPFLVAQPADGNIDRPYDSIPIAEPIAVCMSVKDQAVDMIEFLVHHYHNMGIRRFYIMDDGSDPPLSSFQYPGIPRTALTFTYQERESRDGYMQLTFYTWCIERYRERHTWMAFLDGDEFLETPGPETLGEILKTFEEDDSVGALGINWRMHSSSGLIARPESVRKAFTTCIYDDLEHNGDSSANSHIKSIVKMSHAGPPMNPHKFETSPGSHTVGENGDVIESDAWRRPITRTRIGLHHYAVKSRQEFEAKMERGNGMTDPKGESFWNEIENGNPHVNCSEMAAYEP